MREIKFRGKICEKGMDNCWIDGSLVHITKTYKGEEDEQECDIYQIINEDGVGFFIDKETIGQYTGLKDKNGKEIYEGDIVKIDCPTMKMTGKVFYSENGADFRIYDEQEDFEECLWYLQEEYEVIGNIYENPELLEGE